MLDDDASREDLGSSEESKGKAERRWRLFNGTLIALGGVGTAIAAVIAALHGTGGLN